MTRNLPRAANNVFKSIQKGQTSRTIHKGQTFKRETKYPAYKDDARVLQPPAAGPDDMDQEEEHDAMHEKNGSSVDETNKGTREFYRRSANKRWNHWAMADLDPLPRRTVLNKFKKNKGLFFKRGEKHELSKVNKRAMQLAVQRDRDMKYYEDIADPSEDSLLQEKEEEVDYWNAIPSRYVHPLHLEIDMDYYSCDGNWVRYEPVERLFREMDRDTLLSDYYYRDGVWVRYQPIM